jgi:hypothetical protein
LVCPAARIFSEILISHSLRTHPDKTTTILTLMSTEAVEWIAEGRNVEAVPNQDEPSID